MVGALIGVGSNPRGVAVTPDGTRAYITNETSNSVSGRMFAGAFDGRRPAPSRRVTLD